MHSYWKNIATGEQRYDEIVPVLVLHDPTAFGTEVGNRIYKELKPVLAGAAFLEPVETVLEGAGRFLAPGFRQTLPSALWENQPIWTIWCSGGDNERDLQAKAAKVNRLHPRKFRHFLIRLTPQPTSTELSVGPIPSETDSETVFTHTLLFSRDRLVNGVSAAVVEGTAALFRMAWERYCENRDGNVSAAFHLNGDQRHFTLGCSTCRPDLDFHSERVGKEIVRTLCERMLQPGPEQAAPLRDEMLERIRILTEGSPIEVYGDSELESGLCITDGEETVHLEYLPEARLQLSRSGTQRKEWIRDSQRLRNFQQTFSLLIQPHLAKRAAKVSERIEPRQEDQYRSYLELPDSPNGLCDIVRKRLALISEQMDCDGETHVELPHVPKDFETDERRLHESISAIPERRSIWLRAGMGVVGLAWLILGPWLYGSGEPPFSDEESRPSFVSAFALMLIVPAGLFLRHLFVQARTIRRFDTALSRIHARQLGRLSETVAGLIRESARKLHQRFGKTGTRDGAQAEIEAIREALQNLEASGPDSSIRNRAPFFDAEGVDRCTGIHLDRWSEAAWIDFREQLKKQAPARDTIWPDANDWVHCLDTASQRAAREGLQSIPIDEITEACNGDPQQRRRLFHDHSEEASTPFCEGMVPLNYAKVFVGPPEWYEYRGKHDDWRFHNSLDTSARFIAIMPIDSQSQAISEPCSS